MPTVSRELEVSYGKITVGGSSTEYILTDVHTVRSGFLTTAVEFTFIVQSSGSLDQAIQDVEANFTTPDLDLVIRNGSATLLSLRQSDNTGLDAMPAIVKRGDVSDTGRSRLYVVRIELGKPGKRAGVDGLRQNTVTVNYDPSRRRHITIAGEFTAFGQNGARTMYGAKIDALCSAALSAYTGTFELALETKMLTVNDKSATFSRTYDEVIYDQGGGGLANTSIVRQSLVLSKNENRATPQSPDAQTWITSSAVYDCWIDKTVTQDLTGQWSGIKSFIVSKVSTLLGGGTTVLLSDEPRFDYDNNRITATMQFATAPGEVLEYTFTVTDDVQLGEVLIPVWNGKPLARYRYQGPAHYLRTVSETMLQGIEMTMSDVGGKHASGAATGKSAPSIGGIASDINKDATWVLLTRKVSKTPRIVGIGANTQLLTAWNATSVYEKIEEVGPTTPSGGGGVTTPSGNTGGGGTDSTATTPGGK